ncbi:MAG: peptidoglycan editing factor PgeF [Pseudomonadota bacterium]|nr:peptidoglycan editing factor PgeF [Pseudomonadota bacterium]
MKSKLAFGLDGSGAISYFTIDTGLPVWAAFSTRKGGISDPPYATANMAYHVGDDSLRVKENRRLLSVAVTGSEGVPVYTASQVHGCSFLAVDGTMSANELEAQPADSLITAERGILLGMMTADCLPVLLIDRQARAVAAVHAGWRGILARVVPRTMRAMEMNYGVTPADLLVLLGPCIGHCCYQVGEELIKKFAAEPPFAVDHKWHEELSGNYYLDLVRLQVLQLQELGVLPAAIKVANLCTACENFFFSYRREHGITGRQIAVVGLIG